MSVCVEGGVAVWDVHECVGLSMLAMQALSGLLKMVVKARDGRNILGCHGLSGMGVYLLCMATAISGFNAFFPDFTAWRIVVSVRYHVLLLALGAEGGGDG